MRTRIKFLVLFTVGFSLACSDKPEPAPSPAPSATSPAERAAAKRSSTPTSAATAGEAPNPNRVQSVEALRLQLLAMAGNDQEIRNAIFSKPVSQITKQEGEQLEALDKANTARMMEILDERGWPGKSLVGAEAANGAFLIVQHGSPELQKKALPMLERAYKAGEATGEQLAMVTDRVRLNAGQPQLYGTRAKIENDILTLEPIEDEANVDKRRAALGLPPMKEYVEELKKMYKVKN